MRLWLISFVFLVNLANAQHACVEGKVKFYQTTLGKGNTTNEQIRLMEKVDMRFAHLNLQIDTTNTYISASVKLVSEIREATDTFLFELHQNLGVDSISGLAVDTFYRNQHTVYCILNRVYLPSEKVELTVFYKGTPPDTAQSAASTAGFNNKASPTYGNRITWSLSQPYSAYEWWPCKQSLQDKLDSVWVFITTSAANTGASNGLLTHVENLPAGKKRYEWKSAYPISYYLVSVAVGNYTEHHQYARPVGATDSVFIQNFLYSNPAAFTNIQTNLLATKPMLEVFSEKFGLYPFHQEKYGHAMAPISGGMEHQTMTTQGIFTFDVVAHELGHQWFGDAVTCASWQDIWLNEGFASYCEYLAYEFLNPSEAPDVMNQMHTQARFNTQLSVWVDDTTDVERIFDYRNTYRKGAAILHTIRYVVNNDSVFFHALKTYINRHLYGNASVSQFKQILEEVTAKEFDYFFDQWYYAKGIPIFSLKWNQVGNVFFLESKQKNSALTDTTLFTIEVPYRLYYTGGDTTIYLLHDRRVETYAVYMDKTINAIELDPDNHILKWVDSLKKETGWVGLTDFDAEEKGRIYPNPVKDELIISGLIFNEADIHITDVSGKTVIKKHLSKSNTIGVHTLPPGCYFLHVFIPDTGIKRIFKFIKQ